MASMEGKIEGMSGETEEYLDESWEIVSKEVKQTTSDDIRETIRGEIPAEKWERRNSSNICIVSLEIIPAEKWKQIPEKEMRTILKELVPENLEKFVFGCLDRNTSGENVKSFLIPLITDIPSESKRNYVRDLIVDSLKDLKEENDCNHRLDDSEQAILQCRDSTSPLDSDCNETVKLRTSLHSIDARNEDTLDGSTADEGVEGTPDEGVEGTSEEVTSDEATPEEGTDEVNSTFCVRCSEIFKGNEEIDNECYEKVTLCEKCRLEFKTALTKRFWWLLEAMVYILLIYFLLFSGKVIYFFDGCSKMVEAAVEKCRCFFRAVGQFSREMLEEEGNLVMLMVSAIHIIFSCIGYCLGQKVFYIAFLLSGLSSLGLVIVPCLLYKLFPNLKSQLDYSKSIPKGSDLSPVKE